MKNNIKKCGQSESVNIRLSQNRPATEKSLKSLAEKLKIPAKTLARLKQGETVSVKIGRVARTKAEPDHSVASRKGGSQ